MDNDQKYELQQIKKTVTLTIVANVFLSGVKIVGGFFGNSFVLVVDGFHSLTDVFSTLFAYLGARLSRKEIDDTHHYGHEKIEALVALLMGLSLIGLSLYLAYQGIIRGIEVINDTVLINPLSPWVVWIAVLSIIVNELIFRYAHLQGKAHKSMALIADAWHHRFDALSSIGSLVGILGVLLGFLWMDAFASIIVSLLIFKVAYAITQRAIHQLIDSAPDIETMNQMKTTILSVPGVMAIDDIKGRLYAEKMFIDVEIAVDQNLSLKASHQIAEKVHLKIEEEFKKVKHCMVHVNPFSKPNKK